MEAEKQICTRCHREFDVSPDERGFVSFSSGDAVSAREQVAAQGRQYRCPHCGHRFTIWTRTDTPWNRAVVGEGMDQIEHIDEIVERCG